MKHLFLSILIQLLFQVGFPQDNIPIQYANSITIEDLSEHLTILASDVLEGRETGERGQKMAAAYIEHYFKHIGLEPAVNTPMGKSYVQSFNLIKVLPNVGWIKIDDVMFEHFKDFVYTGDQSFTAPIRSKLLFLGAGNVADYNSLRAKGENVLIYSTGDRIYRNSKAQLAYQQGAKNVFIMQSGTADNFKRTVNRYKNYSSPGKLMLPSGPDDIDKGYFLISESMGANLLNADEKQVKNAVDKSKKGKYNALIKLKSKEITFYTKKEIEHVETENVLGFIEGTDKKNECLILSAHYDHIGIEGEKIYNGADDDGSGTVAVMEIAQAFAKAKSLRNGPRRSMLFLLVTGEEKGLLGSSYYVDHPVLPLEQTIANLNIDMIGRIDDKHVEKPDYIYLIGSDQLSQELHLLSEKTNTTYSHLELDYTFNADSDPNRFYYRSDHYNFAKNNIPIIFYFNGTHQDYHRPTDTVDKIDFDILEKRAKLIFHTAWEIANREERPALDTLPENLNVEDSK